MTKLHEILAIEATKEKAAKRLIKESQHTFGKESLFKGQTRRLEMFQDEDKHLETTEHQELETTVDENLQYLLGPVSDWLDVVLTKEGGNQSAVADLKIGDNVLIKNAPATFLLGLEKKLTEIREVYNAIPTLAPGIKWVIDTHERDGVYVSNDDTITFKTHKDVEFRTVAEATKEHPAQVAQVAKDSNIGKYVTSMKSGMMTPAEKAKRISKIDQLLVETKKARMRANNVNIDHQKICSTLFDYINS